MLKVNNKNTKTMSYFTNFSSVFIVGFKFPFSQTRLAQCLDHIETGQLILRVNQFVGNKAKEQISKRWVQENKACQIVRKNNISQPPDRPAYTCISGGNNCQLFGKICCTLFSCNHRLENRYFTLIPTICPVSMQQEHLT